MSLPFQHYDSTPVPWPSAPEPPPADVQPYLDWIEPEQVEIDVEFTLTCHGQGETFFSSSVIQISGVAQPTTYVNADTLTTTVTLTTTGNQPVTVRNGSLVSSSWDIAAN